MNLKTIYIRQSIWWCKDVYLPSPYHRKLPFKNNGDIILIENLAVGGSWGGAKGIDDSIFPAN